MAETTLVDRIREELMENLEEEWDITQSLTEIKLLDQENKTWITELANELEELISQKEQVSQDGSLSSPERREKKSVIWQWIEDKLVEINNLEEVMNENER